MEYCKRSTPMAISAMALGAVSLMTWCLFYISMPTGAVAIILAVLSRGGYDKFDAKARVGFILGIVGLVLSVSLLAGIALYIHSCGSFANFMQNYANLTGTDYDELYALTEKLFELYGYDLSEFVNIPLFLMP